MPRRLWKAVIDDRRVRQVAARLDTLTPEVEAALGQAIRRGAESVRTQAVTNVSGYPVLDPEGGLFRVRTATGTLKGSIDVQWPYGSPLVARIFVNGTRTASTVTPGGHVRLTPVSQYAAAIEFGHGEIDLKKSLQGKTVPFFATVTQRSHGPFAGLGAAPIVPGQTGIGSKYGSATLNLKLATQGKAPMEFEKRGGSRVLAQGHGSSYLIAFRRVGRTGWIVPAAKPRPFMAAALRKRRPEVMRTIASMLGEAVNAA